MKKFPCDVCGSYDSIKIPEVKFYSDGTDLYVCKKCGFVYAHERREDKEIIKDWSSQIFAKKFTLGKKKIR